MNETIEAFPLHWPLGYKRTSPGARINSPFKQSMEKAQQFLRKEVERIKGRKLIVSSNVPVRKDGGLFTDWMSRKLDDPGVAIYFQLDGEQISMCCDQYKAVWENVYALGKSIEALRAIDRYGTSEFIKRAFTGFKELPGKSTSEPWWEVLGVSRHASSDQIYDAYRAKAKVTHPDAGGSSEQFIKVQQAYQQACQNG